jgi:hypothetical protein
MYVREGRRRATATAEGSNKQSKHRKGLFHLLHINIKIYPVIRYNLTVVAADYKPYQSQDKYQLQLQLQLQCQKVEIHQFNIIFKIVHPFYCNKKRCENKFLQTATTTAECMYMFCMHKPTQKQNSRLSASLPPCPITLLHSSQHQSSQSSSSTEPGCWRKVG